MKPMIGITCNFDDRDDIGRAGQAGASGRKWHFLSDNYIGAIERAGGILDLELEGNFEHHFMDMYPMNRPVHRIQVKAGSGVFGIFGKEVLETNSFHHQGVKEVAEGFEISGLVCQEWLFPQNQFGKIFESVAFFLF